MQIFQLSPAVAELSGIWLDHSIRTNKGKSAVLREGMSINVIDGEIQKDATVFNSKIIGLYGTVDSKQLQIMVFNYGTNRVELLEVR